MIQSFTSLFYTPPSPVQPFDTAEIKRRLEAFQTQIGEYAKTLENEAPDANSGLDKPAIKVKVHPFKGDGFAYAFPKQTKIYISPLLLLKPSDFPKHIQESGFTEESLEKDGFAEKLEDWICKKFNINKDLFSIGYKFKNLAQVYFKLYGSGNYSEVQKFLIAREFAHIHHKHIPLNKPLFYTSLVISCFVLPIIAMNASIFIAIVGSIAVLWITNFALNALALRSRHHAKESDLTALKLVKKLNGAETFYGIDEKTMTALRQSMSRMVKILHCVVVPDVFFGLTNVSAKDRLAYLREAHAQSLA